MKNDEPKDQNHPLTTRDKQSLATLFNLANKAERQQFITVSENETEAAYEGIRREVEPSGTVSHWTYAAAAVVLIGLIGISWALTPKTITVPNGSIKTVQLSEETIITLNSGSSLSYPRWYGFWGREVSLNGEALFEVHHNGEPFVVETPNARIFVMGTTFNVRTWPTGSKIQTSVFLKEGKVAIRGRTDNARQVILEPGQISSISGDNLTPETPTRANVTKVTAWLENGLAFNNQPLSVIFDELSRRFDVTIRVQSEHLLNERLTLYISKLKGIEQTIADICKAKNLIYSKDGDTFMVSGN